MAYTNLRQFIEALERAGRLKHVTAEVDRSWEIACVARWVIESVPAGEQFAIQFDNVKGFQDPVVVGLYSSRDLYATALETAPECILDRWGAALQHPIEPRTTTSGPVKEIVRAGAAIDLDDLPVPVWTPQRDSGPYIPSAAVITKDPETGIQNMGVYRLEVQSRDRLGLFFGTDRQHGAIHYAKHCRRNEPMPVALVIGGPPAVQFAAAAKTAYGVDELEIAGGLLGSPIDVVSCETVDLLVPAQAEYVIEGLVAPFGRFTEGPFGEALGYMNLAGEAPVIEVTAICHRRSPVHHGYVQQLPPSDGHLVMENGLLGPLWYYLTRKLRLQGIMELAFARGSAGLSILVVQIDRSHAHRASEIGRAVAKFSFGQKFIYLVDQDIDIRDQDTLNWALSSRVDPERDIQIISDTSTFQYDPASLSRAEAEGREMHSPPFRSSMAIIDATLKCIVPEVALPGGALMRKVLERWDEIGLPGIRPRGRLQRLLDNHSEKDVEFPLRRMEGT